MRTMLGFLFCFSFLTFGYTQADSSQVYYRIVTTDGNEFIGSIERASTDTVFLNTKNLGVLKIPQDQVEKQQKLVGSFREEGEFWPDNPQSSRYYFAPNGYGLKAGEGYYQNLMVFYNQVSFGFSDYFTMGFGTVPLFMLDVPTPIWITPKVSFPIIEEKLNAGAGAIAGTVIGGGVDPTILGIGYGVVTYGSRDQNINLGVGYGFADGDWTQNPVLNLGVMLRLSRRSYLISENWVLPSNNTVGLIMLGGRTVWPQISLDYGVVFPAGADVFIGIPWIGIAKTFERPES